MLLILSFLLHALAAAMDGVLEGYGFDGRKSFERKWGIGPTTFFGSLSHLRKWGRWYRLTGGVSDFYHWADDARAYGYRIAGFALGCYVIRLLIASHNWLFISALLVGWLVVGSLAKRAGMWWVRE